jgi:hypothetical protein
LARRRDRLVVELDQPVADIGGGVIESHAISVDARGAPSCAWRSW